MSYRGARKNPVIASANDKTSPRTPRKIVDLLSLGEALFIFWSPAREYGEQYGVFTLPAFRRSELHELVITLVADR